MTERKDTATDEKKAPDKDVDAAIADSVEQVQEKVDDENARGFRGYNPDSTPNEHYTFAGQAAGKPTPETDPKLAAMNGRAVHQHAGYALRDDAKKDTK
jgi:hypothetical protein